MATALTLYNTLTRRKEAFAPLDAGHVRMYVCGPTVYSRPHLGNARSVAVYDLLFRLLRHRYGAAQVIYARNITDVDDKINAAAVERGISIQQLTADVTRQFHEDMAAIGCLRPTIEPTATGHIAEIIAMVGRLIENGNAYVAEGHVLFDVTSESSPQKSDDGAFAWRYGMLSGRHIEEQEAGARIAVESYKRHPGDFVLWKPSPETDDPSSRFDSPWGVGRPGWHIECSAMSTGHLGHDFDIHGGGADLMFPHHENEIAQSCCAYPGSHFARYWVHNGFLTVNGEKMAKSLGNFITVRDLLDRGVPGEVIRLALLSTHYRSPLDWSDKLVEDSKKALDSWYRALDTAGLYDEATQQWKNWPNTDGELMDSDMEESLGDDLNIGAMLAKMHGWASACHKPAAAEGRIAAHLLYEAGALLGLFTTSPQEWFRAGAAGGLSEAEVMARITARSDAKKQKNWAEADRIRDALAAEGIILEDKPGGATEWRRA